MTNRPNVPQEYRWVVLVAVVLLALVGVFTHDPIPQSLTYHAFADSRSWLGVPNFLNVASNLLFLYVGAVGSRLCLGPTAPRLRATWLTFFLGVAVVCIGSAYYHWHPDNATLLWDRLPITVAFMALFAGVIAEQVNESLARYLLVPAIVIGVVSVLWWQHTDDLRLYIWVQATPLLIVPLLFVLYPARDPYRRYLLYAIGLYAFAKVFEYYDPELLHLTRGTVSGHTLKHLVAALSTYLVYQMLKRRGAPKRGL